MTHCHMHGTESCIRFLNPWTKIAIVSPPQLHSLSQGGGYTFQTVETSQIVQTSLSLRGLNIQKSPTFLVSHALTLADPLLIPRGCPCSNTGLQGSPMGHTSAGVPPLVDPGRGSVFEQALTRPGARGSSGGKHKWVCRVVRVSLALPSRVTP